MTVDALVLPTMPSVPLLLDDAHDAPRTLRMTNLVRPFNVSGHPVLSLPVLTAEGLPAAIQLVGAQQGDAALCALGRKFEEALR
jgi:amidase